MISLCPMAFILSTVASAAVGQTWDLGVTGRGEGVRKKPPSSFGSDTCGPKHPPHGVRPAIQGSPGATPAPASRSTGDAGTAPSCCPRPPPAKERGPHTGDFQTEGSKSSLICVAFLHKRHPMKDSICALIPRKKIGKFRFQLKSSRHDSIKKGFVCLP